MLSINSIINNLFKQLDGKVFNRNIIKVRSLEKSIQCNRIGAFYNDNINDIVTWYFYDFIMKISVIIRITKYISNPFKFHDFYVELHYMNIIKIFVFILVKWYAPLNVILIFVSSWYSVTYLWTHLQDNNPTSINNDVQYTVNVVN